MYLKHKMVFSKNLSWALWILKVCNAKIDPFVEHESISKDLITLKYLPELEDTSRSIDRLGFSKEKWKEWFSLVTLQECYNNSLSCKEDSEYLKNLLENPLVKELVQVQLEDYEQLKNLSGSTTQLQKEYFNKIILGLSDEPDAKKYLMFLYEFYICEDRISPTYRRMLRSQIEPETIWTVPLDIGFAIAGRIGNMTIRAAEGIRRKYGLSEDTSEHIETLYTEPGFYTYYSTYYMFPECSSEVVENSINQANSFNLVAEYEKRVEINLYSFGLEDTSLQVYRKVPKELLNT